MKTALITGASGGIGAAVARALARDGCAVALHYHQNEAAVRALADELSGAGHSVLVVQGDVSDAKSVANMVDNVLANFCQLDNLICNAGVSHVGLLSDMTDADWRRVTAVNLDGVFYCCRAAIPHFISRKTGCIVTVSSMWGQIGGSCEVGYSAAKAGVIGLTRALAKELGPSGVRVNCVSPGVIDTAMNGGLSAESLRGLADETPLGRIGAAEDVAAAVSYLCSAGAGFVTGQILGVNGGLVV